MGLSNDNLKLIRQLSWEEVFLFWYQNEGQQENWQNLAKERGFASWADWRINGYAKRFECQNTEWALYEVENPAYVVSQFYGGPFRTWRDEYYGDKETMSFAELAELDKIQNNQTIQSMMSNFPTDKIITCLEVKDKIFVIEGSHRSCALALLHKQGKELDQKIILAIGKSNLDKLPFVGQNTLNQPQ